MNRTTPESLDRIVTEGLASRSSNSIEIDTEALEQLGVTPSAAALGMQTGRRPAQDRVQRGRQGAGIAGQESRHGLG
jgi:hypothetical protein